MGEGSLLGALEAVVRQRFGPDAAVDDLARLPGGASRETWGFTLRRAGAPPRRLVLRRDPPGTPAPGTAAEAPVLEAAAAAGVAVPEVVCAERDPAVLGSPFLLVAHVEGETLPRRILRQPALAEGLAARCGEALAALHRLRPAAVPTLVAADPLAQVRQVLDVIGEPHPVFELALCHLQATRPPAGELAVVHGDFRNGNLVVGPDGLRAVLDWELAHIGDPLEDLGWLCTRAWRFGSTKPVGGFGTYDELLSAYEAASGRRVDREALSWWEAAGSLRWGAICLVQAATHRTGSVRSVELAAIGRRVCEQEWDLLELLFPASEPLEPRPDHPGRRGWAPHDEPAATELLEAVRGFLDDDLAPSLSGRLRYHVQVAANVVAQVAREIAWGEELERRHAEDLARLGVATDAEVASSIRQGRLGLDDARLLGTLRATVAAKLAVARPGYAEPLSSG